VSYEKKNGVQKAPHKVPGSSFVHHAISIEYINIDILCIIIHTISRGYYNRVLDINMCCKYTAAYTHIEGSVDCRGVYFINYFNNNKTSGNNNYSG